ncbi:AfsR/SARP family transcriptional regulator [Actinocrispum wychmicini]|uniref:DNA-binding SARP family transcriptional activator n=1 Tax=Actinocrispum wychmicini TaxID=1213861 RepID=A0A4R2JSI1_9PSEU|nr:AfsR/SARP family transcriptional regulator [Actinocrispum wychmicini]TCO62057.1 DNA-binding SARP family transcriptional activator [Actinocrispum wychmicini]
MRFKLFDSLQVHTGGGTSITPTARMPRRVLALLLLDANRIIRCERLVQELWDNSPPRSARTTMHTYIYHLRRHFGLAYDRAESGPGEGTAVLTRPSGYELRLGPDDWLDVRQFGSLVARATTDYRLNLLEDAEAKLSEALALYTGPVLADVTVGPVLSAEVHRMEEMHRSALDMWLGINLQFGRHNVLLDELRALVETDPTHEGFVAKLMLALVRSGQRTAALDTYQRTRQRLVAEYGLEPAAKLQDLHYSILTDEASLIDEPATPKGSVQLSRAPAQLPAEIADFVGRGAELAALTAPFTRADTAAQVPLIEVVGPPGIGKTTFAIHAARRLRPFFPDGQFYEELGTVAGQPNAIETVLRRMLRACGIAEPPSSVRVAELAAMYRTWTADRRVLVVLDDVDTAAQLRALQPAGKGCTMLITSRMRLNVAGGAHVVQLGSFTVDESVELLRKIVGAQIVDAELASAKQLAELCDHWPLAVRAVASRLSGKPAGAVEHFTNRFATSGDPFGEFGEFGEFGSELLRSVRTTCARLGPVARDTFHLLASRRMTTLRASAVEQTLGLSRIHAEAVLEQLLDAQLLVLRTEQDEPAEPDYLLPSLLGVAARSLRGRQEPAARVSTVDDSAA